MITFEGLTKRYGDTRAVDSLDITVSLGGVSGFLRPNGDAMRMSPLAAEGRTWWWHRE